MIGYRFSAAAETYDRHARPQLTLAQAVISILPEIYPEQILELGAGTGQLTRLLVDRFPEVPIDAVDVAERMLARSRAKFSKYKQIDWIQADAQTHLGADPYPLVASSAALHWTADFGAACANIFRNVEPGGTFALGMMLRGTLKELHELRLRIAPHKAPAKLLPTYDETRNALKAAGFRIERQRHSEEEIFYDSANGFLTAIHEQGVTGGKVSAGRAPLTRGELDRLERDYQAGFAAEGGVYATYETAVFLLVR